MDIIMGARITVNVLDSGEGPEAMEHKIQSLKALLEKATGEHVTIQSTISRRKVDNNPISSYNRIQDTITKMK